MWVGVVPGIFFTPRILLGPKVFYQCMPSLGFVTAPIRKGVSPSVVGNTILVPLYSICLDVLSWQLTGCFKCSSWVLT